MTACYFTLSWTLLFCLKYWLSLHRTYSMFSIIKCSIMTAYHCLFNQSLPIDIWVVSRPLLLKILQQYAYVFWYFCLCIFRTNFSSVRITLLSTPNSSVWAFLFLNQRRPQWHLRFFHLPHPPNPPLEGQRGLSGGVFYSEPTCLTWVSGYQSAATRKRQEESWIDHGHLSSRKLARILDGF